MRSDLDAPAMQDSVRRRRFRHGQRPRMVGSVRVVADAGACGGGPAGAGVHLRTWSVDAETCGALLERRPTSGFLIVEGLLLREVQAGSGRACVPLGPDDFFLGGDAEADSSVLAQRHALRALTPVVLAEVDESMRRSHCELTTALLERTLLQPSRLMRLMAVRGMPMTERTLALLWHLADLWGHVGPEGTVLPYPLTHGDLAALSGARRPSITTAVGALRDQELVRQLPERHWLLRGQPPAWLSGEGSTATAAGEPVAGRA